MSALLPLALAALGMTGCNPEHGQTGDDGKPVMDAASSPAVDRIRERGKAIVAQTFSLLSSNLTAAMAAGGPTNAIPFCSVHALPLTASVATDGDFVVSRVSHRARNPTNRVSEAEQTLVRGFQTQLARGETLSPVVVAAGSGYRFYAPIVINLPACLNCHGDPDKDLKPETRALLAKFYPTDEATGFKQGDLRGLWRIDFNASR